MPQGRDRGSSGKASTTFSGIHGFSFNLSSLVVIANIFLLTEWSCPHYQRRRERIVFGIGIGMRVCVGMILSCL